MKQTYDDLSLKTGPHIAGIVYIKVAPREWLDATIERDFDTGKIITPVVFIAGKDWLTFDLAPKSYDYDDSAKSNKSGGYRQVNASGLLNTYTPEIQRVLDTLKYHELVVMAYDKNKLTRLIGDTETGMILSAGNTIKNNAWQETVQISLAMECEDLPPFYDV